MKEVITNMIAKYKGYVENINLELNGTVYTDIDKKTIGFCSMSCYESFINDLETILERTDK